ncbi:MAG TPA: J domain-containing protein [Vicinamibacterales bacterium]
MTFGRILDEKLNDDSFAWSSPRTTNAPSASWRPSPQPVFLFGDFLSGFTADAGRLSSQPGRPTWFPAYEPPQPPRRPVRHLSATEQQALDCLRGMGAQSLHADFTDAEVKSAFRALARKFHPDRHPGSGDQERARLARAFASVCDAYRTLAGTVTH